MKMIIDISKDTYDDIKYRFEKQDYECGYIVASAIVFGTPLEEEIEKLKVEIVKEKCDKCEVDYNIQKCYEDNTIGWCDVFDNLTIIDNRIKELKGNK